MSDPLPSIDRKMTQGSVAFRARQEQSQASSVTEDAKILGWLLVLIAGAAFSVGLLLWWLL